MLSGDAARPGKNAARVLLGSVCRKPVKEVWLQRGKNQDDGQRLYTHTRKEDLSSSHLAPQKTKHPSRLTEWTLSGSPRLFTDKLFILNNLSVKPHLFTDKLSILSQLFTVIRFMVASQTASHRKKQNIQADSPKLVKPNSDVRYTFSPAPRLSEKSSRD